MDSIRQIIRAAERARTTRTEPEALMRYPQVLEVAQGVGLTEVDVNEAKALLNAETQEALNTSQFWNVVAFCLFILALIVFCVGLVQARPMSWILLGLGLGLTTTGWGLCWLSFRRRKKAGQLLDALTLLRP